LGGWVWGWWFGVLVLVLRFGLGTQVSERDETDRTKLKTGGMKQIGQNETDGMKQIEHNEMGGMDPKRTK